MDKLFPCKHHEYCPASFDTVAELEKHLRKCHHLKHYEVCHRLSPSFKFTDWGATPDEVCHKMGWNRRDCIVREV